MNPSDPYLILIPFLVPLVVVIGVVIYLIIYSKKTRRALGDLAASYGAKDIGAGCFAGVINGREFEYDYFGGSKRRTSYFSVTVFGESRGEFLLSEESKLDVFTKKFGFTKEIQTNDPDFDQKFYIQAKDESFTQAFLSDASRREKLKEMARLGFNQIILTSYGLVVKKAPCSSIEDISPAQLNALLGHMSNFLKDTPTVVKKSIKRYQISGEDHPEANRVLIPGIVVGFAAVILWGMSNALYSVLNGFDLFWGIVNYCWPFYLLALYLIFQFIKGKNLSGTQFLSIFFMYALFVLPFASTGGIHFLNGFLDKSQAQEHVVEVLEKYTTRSKSSTYYHAKTSSWRPNRTHESLEVEALYPSIIPKKTKLIITTKKGALGIEWIVGLRIYNG